MTRIRLLIIVLFTFAVIGQSGMVVAATSMATKSEGQGRNILGADLYGTPASKKVSLASSSNRDAQASRVARMPSSRRRVHGVFRSLLPVTEAAQSLPTRAGNIKSYGSRTSTRSFGSGPDSQFDKVTTNPKRTRRARANNSGCSDFCYIGGPVIHDPTVYLIFWLPSGSAPVDDGYEQSIIQFFRDVGGTPYYGLLSQYADSSGPPGNSLTLGGAVVDTSTDYQDSPLTDADVQSEINQAIDDNAVANPSSSTIYFVYTAPGAESGTYHSAESSCEGGGPFGVGCASPIYANMAYEGAHGPHSSDPNGPFAFGGDATTEEISASAHELFEAVTDPFHGSWAWDGGANGGEVADLCQFSSVAQWQQPDGSDVRLHGHEYLLQPMWSNAAGGCDIPQSEQALVGEPGCTENTLPANDDGSTDAVPLPFPVNFFGNTYNQLYVNNNGNVTFDAPLNTYTPFGLTAASTPIIAPFFADVDTRGDGSEEVTYGSGPGYFCVNWVNVGYYDENTDKLDSFQLILRDASSETGNPGDFDIEFNYGQVQWETGDASSGYEGLGGSSARVGYSNGSSQSLELSGSGINGALLDGGPDSLTFNSQNSTQQGRYIFPVRNGGTTVGQSIYGTVTDSNSPPDPVAGALVQICGVMSFASTCSLVDTTPTGQYSAVGVLPGQYQITVSPPTGSPLFEQTQGTVLAPGSNAEVDFALSGPQPLPHGTSVQGSYTDSDGTPVLYWQQGAPLSTSGCANGTASFSVSAIDSNTGEPGTSTGTLSESPPGSGNYTGTIPPLYPLHGAAEVTISITCPDATQNQDFNFAIYIDPSGTVVDTQGNPVSGATVTLLSSDEPGGPFAPVAAGSPVMSVADRNNPDMTSSAGTFGWDVVSGYYEIQASKSGCVSPTDPSEASVTSPVFQVPPPQSNLVLALDCSSSPTATALALSSTNTSPTYGSAVSFTGSLTPGSATGSVEFWDGTPGAPGSSDLGGATVNRGQAVFTITNLPAGADTVYAVYSGGGGLQGSEQSIGEVVSPASLTVRALNQTVSYGQDYDHGLDSGSASVSGLQNGDTFSTLSGGVSSTYLPGDYAGTYALMPMTSDSDYAATYVNGILTVSKGAATGLTVTTGGSPSPYGGSVTFTATLGSSAATGSVEFYEGAPGSTGSIDLGGAPVSGGSASVTTSKLPAGSDTVYAVYSGDENFQGSQNSVSQTVNPAALTITAGSPTITYGQAIPAITASFSGFVNGDSASSLTTQPTCSTTATSTSQAGTYPTMCSGAVDGNYTISYVNGTLTITGGQPPVLTITAGSASMTYGGSAPAISPSYSGFKNGDTAASLTTQPTCSTTATSTSHAGIYATMCSGASDPNYTIVYVNGSLTITPAALTIRANNQSIRYSSAIPKLTYTGSGFVNGDTLASLASQPDCDTTAMETNGNDTSPVGTYAITCDDASSSDYSISYMSGTLTVQPDKTVLKLLSSTSLKHGQAATFTISLMTKSGVPVSGRMVKLVLGSSHASCQTDNTGVATCMIQNLQVKPGTRTLKLYFAGDAPGSNDFYGRTSAKAQVTVK